jgi:hypothetical protein
MNEAPLNPHQHVNPYIAGSPVTGTEMFYGREDVFAFIRRNLIGRHRDTPVVLYGQRRTGKTSVLYQLHRHLDPSYRCIFLDLHGLNLHGMGNLMLGIARSIRRGLQRDHELAVEVPDRAVFLADPRWAFEALFLDRVWTVLGKDHLVLMMDEVIRLDEEVKAGRLARDIFDYLRHLMQHHPRLNFIFSLGSGLEEMAKDYAFLFSVSLYHRISFLEPAAATALITQPIRNHYRVAEEATGRILQITSCHPYYTQLVCHCLFDFWARSPKREMTADDVDAVLAEAIELGSANLTYVWQDSTPEEQALMGGLAAAMRSRSGPVTIDQIREVWHDVNVSLPERQLTQAIRSLTSREVVAGTETYSFAVDLQRRWLDQHRRLDWVKQELANTLETWNRSAEATNSTAIPGKPDKPQALSTTSERRRKLGRTGRRYIAAAIVLLSYLAVAATAHMFPFPRPSPESPARSASSSSSPTSPMPSPSLSTLASVPKPAPATPVATSCQPDGTGCTKVGTYRDPNAVISLNYNGFRVTWTSSSVQPYTSGVGLFWTVGVTYKNVESSAITVGCPGNWAAASFVVENMSGGAGDDGLVPADGTTCSGEPDWTATVPPDGAVELFATFHNVPWPGSAVAITWGDAGTSPSIYPFS